jgi:putative ABC transport system permease protein
MLIHFLRTTFRNLLSNKAYSLLNIFGLALGVACAGLIFLWVENETGFDSVNIKKDRLYMAMDTWQFAGHYSTYGRTAGPLGGAMKAEIPGVYNACRISGDPDDKLFTIGDRMMYAPGVFADSTVFSMLTLPLTEGNAKDAFREPYSIVITESTAKKFFGSAKNIIGRTLNIDHKQNFTLTGVIQDFPSNATLRFDWIAPFAVFLKDNPRLNFWQSNSIVTLVELNDQADLRAINKQLYHFIATKLSDSTVRTSLFPMKDWHLRWSFEDGKQTGGGRIIYVRLFTTIAWIILLLACINFMNLATARSAQRAKEVGVRKVLGSGRSRLIRQFIGEAMIMSLLSVLAAVLMMTLALPAFNLLMAEDLSLHLSDPMHLAALVGLILACGLLAGSYPAIYLSSFNPVFVLKGLKLKTSSASLIRRVLVVFQFAISIVLIISTVIIYQQIRHLQDRDLGYDRSNLVVVPVQGGITRQVDAVKTDLVSAGLVQNAALADYEPIYNGQNNDDYTWKGKDPQAKILISNRGVSPGLLGTFGIQLLQGRDFHADPTTETSSIIISESLAKMMNSKNPLGQTITEGSRNYQIVGVIRDLVYGDMFGAPSDPLIFFCIQQSDGGDDGLLYLRLKKTTDPEAALEKIGGIIRKAEPSYPFSYRFVDDEVNEFFSAERMTNILSRIFAGLAIAISCLGLFGLAAYTAERRTKEMGIRKVLGASAGELAILLSKDFVRLILLSALIAFPLAWYAMNAWLHNYAYRIGISWWVFVSAAGAALLIALMTICYQSVKTAIANPVKGLRAE